MVELFPPPLGARIVGRFELLAPLRGQGAVRTFLARDLQTKQRRALSLFDPTRVHPDVWHEFARLVAAAAEARVPGLVLPAEVPADPLDPPHIVHDPPANRDLDRLRAHDGRIPWQRALAIGERIAGVVHGVFVATGVAHRQLTPSRCLVDARDEVEVLDFGVALFEPTGDSSDEPDYRAPEQRSGQGDPRSDVYALAAILFELLCGECFSKESSLRELANVPPAVDALLSQALAQEPDRRPADLGSLRAALRELLGLPALPTSSAAPDAPKRAPQDSPAQRRGELPPLSAPPPSSSPPISAPRPAPARPAPTPRPAPLEPLTESTERLPPITSAPKSTPPDESSTERLPARPSVSARAEEPSGEPTLKWGKRATNPPVPPERTDVLSPVVAAAQPIARTEVLRPPPHRVEPEVSERTEVLRTRPRDPRVPVAPSSEHFDDKQTVAMPTRKRLPQTHDSPARPPIEPTIIASHARAPKPREKPAEQPLQATLELSPAGDARPALRTTLLVVNIGLGLTILFGLLWVFS